MMQGIEYWETAGWAGIASKWRIIQRRGRTERGNTASSWCHVHIVLGSICSVELKFKIVWKLITTIFAIQLFWRSDISLRREHWQWSHCSIGLLTIICISVVGSRWAGCWWRWLPWPENYIWRKHFSAYFFHIVYKMASWSIRTKAGCVICTT